MSGIEVDAIVMDLGGHVAKKCCTAILTSLGDERPGKLGLNDG